MNHQDIPEGHPDWRDAEIARLRAENERLASAVEKASRHLKDQDIWIGRERAVEALDAVKGEPHG